MAAAPENTLEAPARRAFPAGRVVARPVPEVHVYAPRKPGVLNSFREVWRFRRLFYLYGSGFLEKRYGRSFLGLLWVPLRPGIAMITKIFVYGGLIGAASAGIPYSLAFLTGTAAWEVFHEGITWSARSIQVNRKTAQQVYTPRALLGLSAIVPTTMEFSVNFIFLVAAIAWYGIRAHHFYVQLGVINLLVPLGLLLSLLMAIGIGLTLSGLGARGRDVQFFLPFAIGLGYFLTPVIYPLTTVPPHLRRIEELNPMSGTIEMVRDGLFHTHSLSLHAALVPVIATALIWGPLFWIVDRREVRLLNLPTRRSTTA
jgi:lipopolysaccharide transport system permease protein